MFKILRHGGNSNHDWRVVYETNSRDKAYKKFEAIYKKMRQGGLKLVNSEDNSVVREYYAPRLRTRW